MIILGFDPGTARTGWGVIKGFSMLGCGVIETSKNSKPGFRLKKIYEEAKKIITLYKPDVIAIEKLFFFKNLKTALPVSETRGVLLLLAAEKKAKVQEFTPLEVKTGMTGYGRADKKQIQKMVKLRLNLKETPKPDDTADALAIAICAFLNKCPLTEDES